MKGRMMPWLLVLGGCAGILALSAWYFIEIREASSRGSERWVRRVSELLLHDREAFAHWMKSLEGTEPTPELLNKLSHGDHGVVAVVVTDLKAHTTLHWASPTVEHFFRNIDPRLGILEAHVQETHVAQTGPVVRFGKLLYNSAARPISNNRIMTVVAPTSRPWSLLDDESQAWGLQCSVYDMDEHPIYTSQTTPFTDETVRKVLVSVREKIYSGPIPLDRGQGSQWMGTYYYDPGSNWVFLVARPAHWVYLPVVFFLTACFGMLLLIRVPLRGAEELRRQHQAAELQNWARRVDSFVRGRDPSIKDPPYPFQELSQIVMSLRWLMPQWQKAEAYPRELALERKLLGILVESLPEAILFFNASGTLQLSNELGRVFFGMQQEAGRDYKMINGMQVPRGFLEPFVEPVFTGAQLNSANEIEVPWADGKYLYRIWVERVEEVDGKGAGYIVVIRDITFRRNWEYVQEQVLSGITHDLRGPLSAVMGYLDLMKRQAAETGNAKLNDYLKLARDAGVRLTQMVSDILDVVRFEQGKIELNIEPVRVMDIFNNLRTTFGVSADQKKINLQFMMDGGQETATFGDPKMLERVFDNLVGNAIKFTPSGGKITITAQQAPGRMTFSVSDTGRGIPREAQSRIFDKFQQVRPGDRSAGYGLGLAVVKFIVQAHRGEIRVESEVGAGSKFAFWIPNQAPTPVAVAAPATA